MAKTPVRARAARTGEWAKAAGRDGALWIDGGGYEDVRIAVECIGTEGFDEDAVRGWLKGAGLLIVSDEQDRAYRARVCAQLRFGCAVQGYDGKTMAAEFVCGPYRYLQPEAETAVLTAAGAVENPGTAESEPRISITAEGDFTLTVNGCVMEVRGGSVIIDSELKDCLSADGAALANDRVTAAEFPKLSPGQNSVSWTGNVTRAEFERRVRYL